MTFNRFNTQQQRESAFAGFLAYKRTLPIADQRALRAMYQNERGNMKAGVMGYMRRTGNLMPTLRGVGI